MAEPRSGPGRFSLSPLLRAAVIVLAACGPLLACWGPEYESVHFNDARPDFFRMPQPWWGRSGGNRALPPHSGTDRSTEGTGSHLGYGVDPEAGRGLAPPERLERRAREAEAAGRFHEASGLWEACRRSLAFTDAAEWWGDRRKPLPGMEDRIRALRAWRGPPDTGSLRLYLQARDLVNRAQDRRALPLLTRLTSEPYRSHADYLRASVVFYTSQRPEVASAPYRALVRRQPRHALALYMIGRCILRPYLPVPEAPGGPLDPAEGFAPESRRIPGLREAAAYFDRCAALEPGSSLGRDAAGMAGACFYRLQDYPEALLRYCRQLAALRPGEDDAPALTSARWCLKRMSLADHRTFQSRAAREPTVAAAYLDLHLYYQRIGQRANHNLGLFALEALKRAPSAALSGRLLSRLADIEDRARRPERALRLADAAIPRLRPGAYRDEARWRRAQALHHLKRDGEALAGYEALAATAGVPRMRRGAHEAAAVLCEAARDYVGALRHYFALDYQLDLAYVMDCLASADDLRGFLKRYPVHARARLVRYSLGLRLLRAGQYDAAASTLAPLGTWLDLAERKFDCSTSRGKPRWPPLRTARFLADAARREGRARTDAQKARIAHRAAAAIFHQRDLLFYNGALWIGWRIASLQEHGPYNIQEPRARLDPREQGVLERYRAEHTALNQALRRFERIGSRYPRTPEAPRALYSAALCCTLLSGLDEYWSRRRDIDYTGKAIALYRKIQRDYPDDPLAVAAARWGGPLPSTRVGVR